MATDSGDPVLGPPQIGAANLTQLQVTGQFVPNSAGKAAGNNEYNGSLFVPLGPQLRVTGRGQALPPATGTMRHGHISYQDQLLNSNQKYHVSGPTANHH